MPLSNDTEEKLAIAIALALTGSTFAGGAEVADRKALTLVRRPETIAGAGA